MYEIIVDFGCWCLSGFTWETWHRGCPSDRTSSSWSRRQVWPPSCPLALGISLSISANLSWINGPCPRQWGVRWDLRCSPFLLRWPATDDSLTLTECVCMAMIAKMLYYILFFYQTTITCESKMVPSAVVDFFLRFSDDITLFSVWT